jgi:D-alanyl-D-alanine carboxypeptidase
MADDNIQIDSSLIPVTGTPASTSSIDSSLIPVAGTQASTPNITIQNLSGLLNTPRSGQTQQQSSDAQATGFDSKTQASLDSLQPDFADRAKQWIQGMRNAGYDPVLHFGYRSPEEQQQLYQRHLAGGPQAVAPPQSYHTYGRAFDWVNKGSQGDLQWDNDKAYVFGQNLAKNYGLTGIGPSDNDHIQDGNFKSWKDLPRSEYGNVKPRQQQTAQASVQNRQPLTIDQYLKQAGL